LAHQEITQDWWERQLPHYHVYVSELVLLEAQQGDPEAAKRRLEIVGAFPLLEVSDAIRTLAGSYVQEIPLPHHSGADALHMAIASWHRMDYLLIWNCRHIARGFVKRRLLEVNSLKGLPSPTICTPEELLYEGEHMG
jgi:hypothetical protein